MEKYPFNKTFSSNNIEYNVTPFTTSQTKPIHITSANIAFKNTIATYSDTVSTVGYNNHHSKYRYLTKKKSIFLILILLCFMLYKNRQTLLLKLIRSKLIDTLPSYLPFKKKIENYLLHIQYAHDNKLHYQTFIQNEKEQDKQTELRRQMNFSENNIDEGFFTSYKTKNDDTIDDFSIVLFNDYFLEVELKKLLGMNKNDKITTLHLSKLTGTLSLKNIRIKDITGIETIENISGLDLSLNQIDFIPFFKIVTYGFIHSQVSIFDKIPQLQYLNLSSNQIISIDDIYNKNITRLDISNNKIIIVKNIGKLYNLQYLNIANNFIKDISSLAKLKKLVYINISYNYLEITGAKTKHTLYKIQKKNKNLDKMIVHPQKEML